MIRKFTISFLLIAIAGLLLLYFFTVNELPERVYTDEQQEYLAYYRSRSISQSAPSLNNLSANSITGDIMLTNTSLVVPISDSHVRASLNARYEEQQGVTVTLYDLEFHGEYVLVGLPSSDIEVELFFPFPGNLETLHDVHFAVDGKEPPGAVYTTEAISWHTTLKRDDVRRVDISYKADGANTFAYGLPRDQRSDVDIVVTIAGLAGSSVPQTSLPATKTTATTENETFTWSYKGLVADRHVQLMLPALMSSAQRIAQLQDEFRLLATAAPILVGLFMVCLAALLTLAGLRIQLEGYLLAGLGLALFYPLLTFTSGLIGIMPAAVVASVVVSGLLFGFLTLATGRARTWRPLAILLLIFAGLFSLGMLTPWRGLLLTGGGLLLLVTFMWAYARRPAGVLAAESDTTAAPDLGELPKTDTSSHCIYCGKLLEDTYTFCPDCGHDVRSVLRCEGCGHQQYVPSGAEPAYCVHCGNQFA